MSRIGRMPITVPAGVDVTIGENNVVTVKGPLGTLTEQYNSAMMIEKDGDTEKEVEVKVFPSYVLIKMIMTEESWHAVRNITGVTGFVGPGSRPTPLSDEEVEALNIEEKKVQLSYAVGDEVIVSSGLFEGYTGTIQSISEDLKKVTVLVKRGRRDMPVEMDATSVRRA